MNEWRNRIVGHGVKPADQFMANPRNWRRHPKAQQEALRGVLREVGWVQQVIENVRTGHLIDGHERVWSALQNDNANVPYLQVDLSEEEEALILATLDPLGAMAQTSKDAFDELLRDVQTGEVAVQQLLADVAKKAELYTESQADEKADALAEIPDEFEGAMMLKPNMQFPSREPFGLPPLRDDRLLELPDDLSLWPGDDLRAIVPPGHYLLNYSTSCRTLDFTQAILAFYTDDARFESVWAQPDKMATRILNAGFMGAVSPNYSLWPDEPLAVHIWQVYRSRWCARYFQEAGISIIPDVNWARPEDYTFCFSGVPVGAPCISIQVQTFDAHKPEDVARVKGGILEALAQVKPERVLFYASRAGRELVSEIIEDKQISALILPTLMDYRREHLARKGGF